MMHKTFWSLFAVLLACSSATAADIRRVVTGLDANNKAIALFDSRLTLNPGRSGIPAANLWITDSSPPGFSFKDDNAAKPIGLPTTARRSAWSNFRRSIPPRKRKWIPIS
jgi:hypothetical protein